MIFIDKALGLYKDLREFCADKASDADASCVWAKYAELLDADIARQWYHPGKRRRCYGIWIQLSNRKDYALRG